MHTLWRPSTKVTFEEFCDIIPDGQKADLIDGVIYMASPDNWEANKLFIWLTHVIESFVSDHELGEVVGSRAAFRLGDYGGPEPDIAFVQASRTAQARTGYFPGAPDLALEIVSPDSIERDYVAKRELYRQAGVREYWIVDPLESKVTLLRLDRRRRYREIKLVDGALSSEVLKGFWIRPEWLWLDSRPKPTDAYRWIVGK
jgi:Uma2 family endonuclease